jgi:hypothetical protein
MDDTIPNDTLATLESPEKTRAMAGPTKEAELLNTGARPCISKR